MKRCLLDMDGVLVDFVKGACDHHKLLSPYLAGYQGFYLNEAWNMKPAEFWEGMDREFWKNLDWTPDGREIFQLLHNHYGSENICLLTSPSSNDGCFDGKMDWIRKHLPKEYHRRFLVGPAKDFCAGHNRVLIDDCDTNVEAFHKARGWTILVPRPWNKHRTMPEKPVEFIRHAIRLWSKLC